MCSSDLAVAKDTPGPSVLVNRASALIGLKRYEDALADSDAAIAGDKNSAEAWHNRASALAGLRRFADAIQAFDKALTLRPGSAAGWINRGNVFMSLTRYDEAIADFERALSLDARNAEAMFGRANTLFHLKRMTEAHEACEAVLRIAPGREDAQSLALRCRLHACDWRDYENGKARIAAGLDAGRPIVSPLDAKAVCTSEAENAQAAHLWMTEACPPAITPLWRGEAYRHGKIRLAYLSSDFRTHAVASLVAGVFEHHVRDRFETIAVSFGPDDGSGMRRRISAAVDRFIDARTMSDNDAAAQLRALEIDIAVDLNGYTGDARTRIFAARPAPIQVN